ncbi:MAG: ABC transporter substrate-binding protein [Streptosporangiaceae bacterium]
MIDKSRKWRAGAAVAGLAMLAAACGAPQSGGGGGGNAAQPTSIPKKPSEPVTLNILDVAGDLQLTKGMIQEFAKKHPDIVSKVTYTSAPAPEMAGKLKAQQQAGNVQTSLVLTGTDGLSAGIEDDLPVKMMPNFSGRFPNLMDNYLKPAAAMQGLAQGYGIEVTYYPSGPLLEYNPKKVKDPPKTTDELLAWAKAHPGKFQYAQPANSGPGRTLLMALPYLLKDKNPKDPSSWTKTWAYLKKLEKYVRSNPSGTTDTMKNIANGSVDMIASTTGWDINPRVLGTVPKGMKVTTLSGPGGFHWVTDAHYAVIPKGNSKDVMAADLALIKWMLRPDQQAKAYDDGYFYPGPAVKDVTLDMAPAHSQQVLKEYGRPQYQEWISKYPKETSLPAQAQVKAFDLWNRKVGSKG